MQWAATYAAAALLATGAVATYATTPPTYTADEIRILGDPPYAGTTNSQKMLLFVSQAERLVFNGDHTFAKMHINEAIEVANQLPATDETENSDSIHRIILLKVMDGMRDYQMMIAQPSAITSRLNIPPTMLAVENNHKITSANVHYIISHWDKAAVLASLSRMLRGIETGKNNAVAAEFKAFHSQLLAGNEHSVSDRRAAQDNVALARALLQVNAFDPAKAALERANAHIQRLATQKNASPKRFEEIAEMRNEMADVAKIIERKEPSAFKSLDAKLQKWWDALS